MSWVLRALALVFGIGLVSCAEPGAVSCSNGLICPAGHVCDEVHGGCSSQFQIAVCEGKPELEPCTAPSVSDGACYEGVCLPAGCGNGVVNAPEVCDDGNRLRGDGCSADCLSNETCGNGVIDSVRGESCDDGNAISGDGCQANCASPTCGDGKIDTMFNEGCDDGDANSQAPDAACRVNCQPARCGDGVTDTNEVCDDGNLFAGDGCSFDCRSNESCGNGYIDFIVGELCDDGDYQSGDGCSSCRVEAPAWTRARPGRPFGRVGHAVAYDAARGKLVLFGGQNIFGLGNDTWEWDGVVWTNVTPSVGNPLPRSGHSMAYDVARRRVVMFGGYNYGVGPLDETWEWDGRRWINVTPVTGNPPPRADAGLVYDSARRQLVLFGGTTDGTLRNDTWTWNGAAWSNVTPASGNPAERHLFGMTYDPARDRVVVFGGYDGAAYLNDTWEWNGSTWTLMSSQGPVARGLHALAYDAIRGQVVLFGGVDDNNVVHDDTWEWNGTAWSDQTPVSGNPSPRMAPTLTFDVVRGGLVLFGGFYNGNSLDDIWQRSGLTWSDVTTNAATPPERYQHALAYDPGRGRVVMFGGLNGDPSPVLADTWEWNGMTWLNVPSSTPSPPARYGHAMAYDETRNTVVLFGGYSGSAYLDDMWEWDGDAWTQLTPVSGTPPPRRGHAMVYDAARGRLVLFGGIGSAGTFADTWEWNGSAWSDVTPSSGNPPQRYEHAMAFDAARGRVVMVGGSPPTALTWEWNGTAWSNVTPASNNPIARSAHAMAYDLARGRVFLFGGSNLSAGMLADVHEWSGTAWALQLFTSDSPTTRIGAALAYDAARATVVMFGGNDGSVFLDDTWTLRYSGNATEDGCRGLDGDRDALVGCQDPDCFGVCSPLCNPTIMACDPAWPRCGDGMCQDVETPRLCPADCGAPPATCGDYICQAPEALLTCPGDCS